jgi:hypothetical protein
MNQSESEHASDNLPGLRLGGKKQEKTTQKGAGGTTNSKNDHLKQREMVDHPWPAKILVPGALEPYRQGTLLSERLQ